jgi:3-oxoacyl-[acyl-carrier-protein] synthase III
MSVGIVGIGAYVPERELTNEEVERVTGYRREAKRGASLDDWVRRHHGGVSRRRAAEGEATSDLATKAARRAICDAGLEAGDLDLIVMATVTSDHRLPPSAALVQANLRSQARYLQLDSACTGFLDSLQVAMGMMRSFGYATVLVVCADTTAFCIDPHDWLTMTVFGDGAAAVVLREVGDGEGFQSITGGSEGCLGHYVSIPAGGSRRPLTGEEMRSGSQYLKVQYGDVHRWAVDRMVTATVEALASAGLTIGDVDWLVPHQASARLVMEAAARLAIPNEKVILTYPVYGNTVGSSLPLALEWGYREGRFRAGQWLLMSAVGAGMAWASAIYRWTARTAPAAPQPARAPT